MTEKTNDFNSEGRGKATEDNFLWYSKALHLFLNRGDNS